MYLFISREFWRGEDTIFLRSPGSYKQQPYLGSIPQDSIGGKMKTFFCVNSRLLKLNFWKIPVGHIFLLFKLFNRDSHFLENSRLLKKNVLAHVILDGGDDGILGGGGGRLDRIYFLKFSVVSKLKNYYDTPWYIIWWKKIITLKRDHSNRDHLEVTGLTWVSGYFTRQVITSSASFNGFSDHLWHGA